VRCEVVFQVAVRLVEASRIAGRRRVANAGAVLDRRRLTVEMCMSDPFVTKTTCHRPR
jgi:hypothetical protein